MLLGQNHRARQRPNPFLSARASALSWSIGTPISRSWLLRREPGLHLGLV